MTLMSFVEKMAQINRTARRANPAKSTESTSSLIAFGWSVTLLMNPRYFADHSFLKPIEGMGLTPWLSLAFFLLMVIGGTSLYLTRDDDASGGGKDALTDPTLAANRTPVYLLRTVGFCLSFAVWLFMGVVTGIASFISSGSWFSPFLPVYVMVVYFSAQYAIDCAFNFSASRVRRRGDHFTLNRSPA